MIKNTKKWIKHCCLTLIGSLALLCLYLLLCQQIATTVPNAVYTVISTADNGIGTLRWCLTQAEPFDYIDFDPTIFSSTKPATITLMSELPHIITDGLTIDASDAGVVIDGSQLIGDEDGLYIDGADNVAIRGLQVVYFPDDGIEITNGAMHNLIGGDWTLGNAPHGEGNVITLNGDDGIDINGVDTMSNTISGNLIGLDVDGTQDFRVQAMAISPAYTDTPTLFVGTRYHGVWRTDDGGSTWAAVNNGLTVSNVLALAISPSYTSDESVFAGTANGGIFKTINSGTTWTRIDGDDIPGNRDILDLAISPNYADDGCLFALDDSSGVFASTDKGDTWTSRNNELGDYIWRLKELVISPDYAADQTLFTFAWNRVFKWVAEDNKWTAMGEEIDTSITALAISPDYLNDRTLFAGSSSGDKDRMFWKSIDGGYNWEAVGGASGMSYPQVLAISPNYATNDTLFAGDNWEGVFTSTNEGGTWSLVKPGRFNKVLAISPAYAQDQTLFVGQYTGEMYKSVNGGVTWNQISAGLTELGNYNDGIDVWGGTKWNTIGGNSPGMRNVISNNGIHGIQIRGSGTNYNSVIGNYVGTDDSGTDRSGNNTEGILISNVARFNRVGGSSTEERNVISGNAMTGISIRDSNTMSNTVVGNFVGIDASGTTSLGNEDGIALSKGTQYNRIEGNVVSGNGASGISILNSGTMHSVIVGNYVGTDASGTVALGNYDSGVQVGDGVQFSRVGGTTPFDRNVISGNEGFGVSIWGTDAMYNVVVGNYIGIDANGTAPLGNHHSGVGIDSGAKYNRIGGATSAERNVISDNAWDGVSLYGVSLAGSTTMSNTVSGNYIGTDFSGGVAIGNHINGIHLSDSAWYNLIGQDNLIAYNNANGVLVSDASTLYNTVTCNSIQYNNDLGIDNEDGGNAELSHPIFTEVTASSASGTASTAHATIELFSDDDGQGRVYEGTTTADASGNFTFASTTDFSGPYLTATATDLNGNTSEFSIAARVPVTIPIIQTSNDQRYPAIVYNSTDDEYLLVWADHGNYGTTRWDIWAQRLSGGGTRVGQSFIISGSLTSELWPRVAYNSNLNEYLVVWYDKFTEDDRDVYAQRVSSTGQLEGERISVSVNRNVNEIHPDVVYNGGRDEYMVVWNRRTEPYGILGQRLTATGVLTGAPITIATTVISSTWGSVLAYNSSDDEYLVVWEDFAGETALDYDVFAQRLSGQGELQGSRLSLVQSSGNQRHPSAIYNSTDGEYLVVWQDDRGSASAWDIYGQVLSSIGEEQSGNFPISTAASEQMSPQVVHCAAGNEYLVTWHDFRADEFADIYGQRISSNGMLADGDLAISTASFSQTFPSGVYNSVRGEYLSVWEDFQNSTDYDIYGRFIQPLPSYNVNLDKYTSHAVAVPGQRITYTLAYSNIGSSFINGVVITDTMPVTLTEVSYFNNRARITPTGNISFAWQVEDLALGQGGIITITAIISPDLDEDTPIVNYATISDKMGQTSATSSVTTTVVIPEPEAIWTAIVYLNGDNDLDPSTDDAFNGMEAGVCDNSGINVIALWDRSPGHSWDAGTRRYKVKCDTDPLELADYVEGVETWSDGELNLGDAQTLYDFASWAQAKYPADHYWLSIIDHGGGWSPDLPLGMPMTGGWHLGGTGLSWDETNVDPDYLSTHEMGQVLRSLSNEGTDPLDVVFYDASLMGLLEEAYEISGYARYFVASENIAWNVLPYEYYIAPITADTEAMELAEHIVDTYVDALSTPGTMSALDLSATGSVSTAVDGLAQAIMSEQYNATIRDQIGEAYMMAQKLDYDGDGDIEQYREGYVDIYDLAVRIEQWVDSAAIRDAARGVMDALDTSGFIHTEAHRSGIWDLDDVHGISIYMPFGEELYIGSGCDEAVLNNCEVNDDLDCIKLRDHYTTTIPPRTQQLSFAQDTNWDEFVNSFLDEYYCSASRTASVLRLLRTGTQGLPPVRPIAILSEPREPFFDVYDWISRPVGGVTLGFCWERSDYLPAFLRGR